MDLERVQSPHTDALVVSLRVGDFLARRILIDPGSSADVVYYALFKRFRLSPEHLIEAEVPLVGFNSTPVWPLGHISMPVKAGTRSVDTDFVVVDVPSPYNIILGRTWLHRMEAIASTYLQVVRFIGQNEPESIYGDQVA